MKGKLRRLLLAVATVALASALAAPTLAFADDVIDAEAEVASAASGTITSCLVDLSDSAETFIASEITDLNATESVVIKLYSGETQIATTTLQKPEYYVMDTLGVKIIITGESSSWETVWAEGMPRADVVPDKVVLYVDDKEMNTADVPMISTDGEAAVNWANVPGVNPAPIVPAGNIQVGYLSASYINNIGAFFGEATGVVGTESFVVKLYSDETLVGTAALVDTDKVLLNGESKSITWHAALADDGDSWWDITWNQTLNVNNIPDKVELWVDGVEVSEGWVQQNLSDLAKPIFAAITDADGNVKSFVAGTGYLNGTGANAPVYDAALQTAANNAAEGETIAILRAGTYKVPTGKDITITGAVDDVVFDNIGSCNMGGANVTFNNVTFDYYPNGNYTGLQHSGNLVYNNCTINGQVFLYGASETFNNCIFNQNSADAYNVWTYGAKEVKFNSCTFNSAGKSVLVYNEGACATDLTVEDTAFNASQEVEGKAAIEIDTSLMPAGTEIVVDAETAATGFAAGSVSGNTLWNDKKADPSKTNGGTTSTVIVNGETVKKAAVTGLSGAGTESDPYLINNLDELIWFRDSVNTYTQDGSNQYKGKYVKLNADIDLDGINWTPIGTNSVGDHMAFLGTFDGDGHTISNLYVNADGDHLGFFARVGSYVEGITPAIKNITFNNVDVSSNTTTGHGGSYVGGVVANAGGNSVISNVKVTGDVYVVGYGYVGGIVGHGYPDLTNCSVNANDGSYLNSYYWCAGGIIGYAGEGGTPITNCSVSGLDIWSAYGGAAAIAGLLQDGNKLENVSASNVEITSNSDYCMGYIAGNGEASTMTGVTVSNVTATANDEPITATDAVASVGTEIYFSLQDAFEAADGETVTLLRDLALTEKVTVKKDATLDLNGKTITTKDIVGSRVIVLDDQCMKFVLNANGGGIKSADAKAYGIIDNESCADVTVNGGTYDFDTNNGGLFKFRYSEGTFTLNDVTVETNAQISGPSRGSLQKLDVNGGTFKAETGYDSHNYFAFYIAGGAVATFDDVTIENKYVGAVEVAGGDATLTDCNISVTGAHSAPYLSAAVAVSGGGSITVNSGNYSTEPAAASDANGQGSTHGSWTALIMSSGGTMTVNGGTFSNGVHEGDATNPRGLFSIGADADYGDNVAADLQINDGTFSSIGALVDCETIWGSANDSANTYMPTMGISITGGDFTGVAGKTVGGCDPVSTDNPVEVEISGGTYSANHAIDKSYLALGYEVTDNADGTYSVKAKVAHLDSGGILDQGEKVRITADLIDAYHVESLKAELYDSNDNLLTTVTPRNGVESVLGGRGTTTIGFMIVGESSSWQQTEWKPSAVQLPDYIKVYINGSLVDTADVVGDVVTGGRHSLTQDEWNTLLGKHLPVAEIGETGYATLDLALEASSADDTITLLKDATISSGTLVSGATLTVAEGATLTISGGSYNGTLDEGEGSIVVKGGTFAADPSEFVAEGYKASQSQDGLWTVEAKPAVYTVTFDAGDGLTVPSQTVEAGKTADKPADPAKDGYTFDGWFLGSEKYDFSAPVTSDITLVAKFVKNAPVTHTVTYLVDGNVASSETVEDGKAATGLEVTREGYAFDGWFTDKELTEAYDMSKPVTADIALYAKFTAVQGGTDEPDTGTEPDAGSDGKDNAGSDSGEKAEKPEGSLENTGDAAPAAVAFAAFACAAAAAVALRRFAA